MLPLGARQNFAPIPQSKEADRAKRKRTKEKEKLRLDSDQNPKDLLKLLHAYPADSMKAYEIEHDASDKHLNDYYLEFKKKP